MGTRAAVFLGAGSLPVRAAEVWLEHGHTIVCVASLDAPLLELARARGIPVVTPGDDLGKALSALRFDHIFSVASPWVLGREVLAQAPLGAINYHDALLPRYAGTHATSWALIHRESRHGVTWHTMAERVDAGDILIQREVAIDPGERAVTLNAKCWEAGLDAFRALVRGLDDGTLVPKKQNPLERTFFGRYQRPPAGSVLSFSRSAEELDALVRALDFGPYENALGRAKLAVRTQDGPLSFLAVTRSEVLTAQPRVRPGTVLTAEADRLVVGTATAPIALEGITALEGTPCAVDALIGRHLGELDRETLDLLEQLDRELAPHEERWVERLASRQSPRLGPIDAAPLTSAAELGAHDDGVPVGFPLPPAPEAPASEARIDAPSGAPLVTALLVLLSRTTGRSAVTVGFTSDATSRLPSAFQREVPLRVSLDLGEPLDELARVVEEALEDVREHRTFPRDLFTRHPALAGRSFAPPLIVAEGTAELPARGVMVLALEEPPRLLAGPGTCAPDTLTAVAESLGTMVEARPRGGTRAQLGSASPARSRDASDIAFARGLFGRGVEMPRQRPAVRTTPARDVRLVTGAERTRMLAEALGPRPSAQPSPIEEAIARLARTSPTALALVSGVRSWTYATLEAEAEALAIRLAEAGARAGALVGLIGERGPEALIAALAIAKAGATGAPLDAGLPSARLDATLEAAAIALVVHAASAPPRVDVELREARASHPRSEVAGAAYVIHTSGTTGAPKGVVVDRRALALHLAAVAERYGLGPADRLLALAPVGFDLAIEEAFAPLVRGGTVVFPEVPGAPSFAELEALIERHGVTTASLSTAYFHAWTRALAAGHGHVPEPLALVVVGTERARPDAFETFRDAARGRVRVVNAYGPTEAVITATAWEVPGSGPVMRAPIGRPLAYRSAYVLGPDGALIPRGMVGEIFLGGPALARGYLGNPALTRARFSTDPFALPAVQGTTDLRATPDDLGSKASDIGSSANDARFSTNDIGSSANDAPRLYRTGDLGTLEPTGDIVLWGRADDQVKVRGHRIELAEIEAVLAGHPAVREVAAAMIGEDIHAKLAACVVVAPGPGAEVDAEALRAFAAARLPRAAVPERFELVLRLPRLSSGKLDRRALAALVAPAAKPPHPSKTAPRDELEARVLAAFERALGRPVGLDDDFFALGGTSLTALSLFADLGVNRSLSALFSAPTVARLAARLRNDDGAATGSSVLVPIQPRGTRPPLFFVHGLGAHVLLYEPLARRLGEDQPFFGLQAIGLDGASTPDRSIEAMAERYVSEIRAVAPRGPYQLGGFSLGGTIAFEMAQQLVRAGERVALLALIDSNPTHRPFDVPPVSRLEQRAHAMIEQTARRLEDIGRLGLVGYASRLAAQLPTRMRAMLDREPPLPDVPAGVDRKSLPPALRMVWGANAIAEAAYRPTLYPGRVTYFFGIDSVFEPLTDLRLTWSDFAGGGFELLRVPGNHTSILAEPAVGVLAEKLAACLALAR